MEELIRDAAEKKAGKMRQKEKSQGISMRRPRPPLLL